MQLKLCKIWFPETRVTHPHNVVTFQATPACLHKLDLDKNLVHEPSICHLHFGSVRCLIEKDWKELHIILRFWWIPQPLGRQHPCWLLCQVNWWQCNMVSRKDYCPCFLLYFQGQKSKNSLTEIKWLHQCCCQRKCKNNYIKTQGNILHRFGWCVISKICPLNQPMAL